MGTNGNLSADELSPAVGGVSGDVPGAGQLAAGDMGNAAAAWNAMGAEALRNQGVHIGCNGPDSMYRSYARQVYWRNYWCNLGNCGNAAVPGYSNHGIGRAVDMPLYVAAICDGSAYDKYGW